MFRLIGTINRDCVKKHKKLLIIQEKGTKGLTSGITYVHGKKKKGLKMAKQRNA